MATGRPAGRPAKPTEQKRLLGNPGKRALPDAPMPGEGLPAVSSIPAPPPLGLDGLELWETLWSAGRSWLSPASDAPMITMLCQAQDETEQIRRSLALGEEKRYYILSNGQQVTSPLVKQLKEQRVQMTAWLAALGFSPTDRARLGLAEVRQNDVLDELEQRRNERRQQGNE